jgi:hypothetical protein
MLADTISEIQREREQKQHDYHIVDPDAELADKYQMEKAASRNLPMGKLVADQIKDIFVHCDGFPMLFRKQNGKKMGVGKIVAVAQTNYRWIAIFELTENDWRNHEGDILYQDLTEGVRKYEGRANYQNVYETNVRDIELLEAENIIIRYNFKANR